MSQIGSGEFCGYRFADPSLLEIALTHRSAANRNNERLEFLGDAALGLVIARALFQHCPEAGEGMLTRLRSHLVRGTTLAEIAREVGLGDALWLGPGELRSGGHRRSSILADAFEAVVGAVLVDGGFAAVEELLLRLYDRRLDNLPSPEQLKDAKTRLQEQLQADSRPLPEYRVVEERGADHARVFVVRCALADRDLSVTAEGSSRRGAEKAAARLMLERLAKET